MAMQQISDRDARGFPPAQRTADRMRDGLIGSLALHALVLLLAVFGLPLLAQAPPPEEHVVPVNLVALAAITAAPSAPVLAPVPQEKAHETAPDTPTPAVPAPETPPPPAEPRAKEAAQLPLTTALAPAEKPRLPRPAKAPKPAAHPAAKQAAPPSPADELTARLKALARLKQPSPPERPEPRQQEGSGVSNLTASSAAAARARDAAYGVKDFIRAQVIRHWNLHEDAVRHDEWSVAIRIVMSPDGKVLRAEIKDDPRFRADDGYRDFARSARNAVLMSSPLTVPAEAYDIAKDIVVDFNPKQVRQ
jgi:outer membrane biosynthesis protein TonB